MVAQRLRKAIGLTEFAEVLGFDWTDDSDWVWNDVSNLVADLIEPEPERTCRNVSTVKGKFTCSSCHQSWRHVESLNGRIAYCPCCGAKVVDDGD